jgi:hypothetical protein
VRLIWFQFREPSNAEGNWEPNYDHVHNQTQNEVTILVGSPCVKRGERQNNQAHEKLDRCAKKQAADQSMLG